MTTATSATTATIRYPEHPVEIVDRHPFVRAMSEASDLGWVPGWWPTTVLFYDGGTPTELVRRDDLLDDDNLADDLVDYASPDGSVWLTVWND